jgi:cytochrome c biogenesis protein CcdA
MELMGSSDIPLIAAFFIGLMTAISPCPMTTNITAIAYVSRRIGSGKHTLIIGLLYALGRAVAYVFVASSILWLGLSSQDMAFFLQKNSDMLLGPFLVILGILMLTADKLPFFSENGVTGIFGEKLGEKGYLGAFLLGVVFALSFCPFSAVLFFGMLIPVAMAAGDPILVPSVFAVATALPVLFFSVLLVYSVSRVGEFVNRLQVIEKNMRRMVAFVFILAGLYCSRLLLLA